MKILWVNTNFLHPTTKGGQIRTLEILRHLKRRHEIHYVAIEDPAHPEAAAQAAEYCARAYPFRHRIPPKKSVAFARMFVESWFSEMPLAVSRFHSPALGDLLRDLIRKERFDRAVVDHLAPTAYFPDLEHSLLFQHNVETMIWRRHAEYAPDPPSLALAIRDDFERADGQTVLPDASVHHEGRASLLALSSDAPAGGKRCLKMTDAADLQFSFNPHFFYVPRHTSGVTRCRFDVKMGPGATLAHEWRDDANPYRVGPSVYVQQGKLLAQGKPLLDVPTGVWLRIEVAAGLGGDSTGTWDLTVTLPGQAPKTFAKLPVGNPAWKKLDWLGFCSVATQPTAIWLDNIELTNPGAE